MTTLEYSVDHGRRPTKRMVCRERRERRRELMRENPHCGLCQRRLQSIDPKAVDYAHLFDDQLLCAVCAHVTNGQRLKQRQRELIEREASLTVEEYGELRRFRRRGRAINHHAAKQQLRDVLMSQCPRCWNCGKDLQAIDPRQAETYANVVFRAGKLACSKCVKVVAALFIEQPD